MNKGQASFPPVIWDLEVGEVVEVHGSAVGEGAWRIGQRGKTIDRKGRP